MVIPSYPEVSWSEATEQGSGKAGMWTHISVPVPAQHGPDPGLWSLHLTQGYLNFIPMPRFVVMQ